MSNGILIFRTDRIGDFLLTLLLINNIKKKYPNSVISVVASEKNYSYIKTFDEIDKVILLKNNFLSKIKLIFKLRSNLYDSLIIHDGKNRSKIVSFFLRYRSKIVCSADLKETQIQVIKNVCKKMNVNYNDSCLDFLDKREQNILNLPFKDYILLHFDEKWFYEKYIKKYVKIEPTEDELIFLINELTLKSNLVITSGKKSFNLIQNIQKRVDPNKVLVFENQNLLEIENIVFKSKVLITCHGWISHVASAKKIKLIDIIDKNYPYDKWTSHFRNYNSLNRKPFQILSKEIINLI